MRRSLRHMCTFLCLALQHLSSSDPRAIASAAAAHAMAPHQEKPGPQRQAAHRRLLEQQTTPAKPAGLRLLLASNGGLFWYSPATDSTQVLHVGQGVHYGAFPGERDPGGALRTVWNVVRPQHGHPASGEWLLELNVETGSEVRRVRIPANDSHDAVRANDTVYLTDTLSGTILQLSYPTMRLVRRLPLFTIHAHVNTLAPVSEGELWAVLHNNGQSSVVRIDLRKSPPQVEQAILEAGHMAHGLVEWGGVGGGDCHGSGFLMLDSADAALVWVDRRAVGGAIVLWKAPDHMFLKGLAVVDDVAYFGMIVWTVRAKRADWNNKSELAAFDLRARKLLWRRTVPTLGEINVVAAPQLGDASSYRGVYSAAGGGRAPATAGGPTQ